MKSRGTKANDAELLGKKWLEMQGWPHVHKVGKAGFKRITKPDGSPVFRRDGKPMIVTESHDLFGCLDLLAISSRLGTWAWQMTTQAGRTERRRKIEAIDWPTTWRVSLVSHEAVEDPANRIRRKHYWRIEDYLPWARSWSEAVAFEFTPSEVEAHAREVRTGEPRAAKAARQAPAEADLFGGTP